MSVSTQDADGFTGKVLTIVGLGLMGGSIAKALRRNTKLRIRGLGRSPARLQTALDQGIIDEAYTDAKAALHGADFVIVCQYPGQTAEFILQNMSHFERGCILTDVCGVKTWLIDTVLPQLRPDIHFVPGHPMAGREKGGLEQSTTTLYDGCNYLLTPLDQNPPRIVAQVEAFARLLGAKQVVCTTPQQHDAMIAYTSQLPHALAVAYVLAADGRNPLPFSAGSYRDVSRVATINDEMWCELFLANRTALLGELDGLMQQLKSLRDAIAAEDADEIAQRMRLATRAKEALQ